MKYNEFIAALVSLQKSDVNPEVTDWDGNTLSGVDFVDNNVVLLFEEALEEDEAEELEAKLPPVEFKAPDFKM